MSVQTSRRAIDRVARQGKLFQGLSERSRLLILYALAEGPMNVSQVCERTGLSQSNTSNHLACLLGCGLVVSERQGRFVFYRHADESISHLLTLADRIVLDATRTLLKCPRCGTRV